MEPKQVEGRKKTQNPQLVPGDREIEHHSGRQQTVGTFPSGTGHIEDGLHRGRYQSARLPHPGRGSVAGFLGMVDTHPEELGEGNNRRWGRDVAHLLEAVRVRCKRSRSIAGTARGKELSLGSAEAG